MKVENSHWKIDTIRHLCRIVFVLGVVLFVGLPGDTKALSNFFGDVEIEAALGIGYDSNVFRAPQDTYIDYAQSGNPDVDPESHAGFYLPAEVGISYQGNIGKGFLSILNYDFDGRYYIDSDLQNANTYTHEINVGLEYVFDKKGKKKDSVYVGPYYRYHYELYNDRDTGEKKDSSGGDDLSEGDSYTAQGIDLEYDRRTTRVQYGADAKYEERDYDDPGVFSQEDYKYYRAGGYVEFPLFDPLKLKLSYAYSRKKYDERSARDLNGSLFPGNDERDLFYNDIGVTLKSRLTKNVSAYLDYDYTRRVDDFEGYHDYAKHKYAARLVYRYKDIRLRGKLAYWTRVYDDAFAFDEPDEDDLKYDGLQVRIGGEYAYSKTWAFIGQLRYDDENSTDDRYEYERYQTMVGIEWKY